MKAKTIHELKTWEEHFNDVFMGRKTFEIRINDRNYKAGDVLTLKEWNKFSEKYTGRTLSRNVTSIIYGGRFGIESGYCVMSIQ